MMELNLDQLKDVVGGNVDFMGGSYTAAQLMELYNTYGSALVVGFVKSALKTNPGLAQQLRDTFAAENMEIPADIAALLN